jgi:alkanesulfonate monooxygenase SsuD/methylene tetrahydromethanopterin reductase-like flavin-dependent oxidoreductase (luciferase family)
MAELPKDRIGGSLSAPGSPGQAAKTPGGNDAMKFGIFYELQLPRPWGPDSEYDLYQNALAQLELADALGYDYAWEVEHHFLEEYSHSSAPEVFLSAASQRTKRIRLGHGIFQLTTNHPAKVAEKVSALDLTRTGGLSWAWARAPR